jgi:hypothetical protein
VYYVIMVKRFRPTQQSAGDLKDINMFTNISGKGFQLTFNNGNTISVQFGAGNYCEHYNEFPDTKPVNIFSYRKESKDAEIAVWNKSVY